MVSSGSVTTGYWYVKSGNSLSLGCFLAFKMRMIVMIASTSQDSDLTLSILITPNNFLNLVLQIGPLFSQFIVPLKFGFSLLRNF